MSWLRGLVEKRGKQWRELVALFLVFLTVWCLFALSKLNYSQAVSFAWKSSWQNFTKSEEYCRCQHRRDLAPGPFSLKRLFLLPLMLSMEPFMGTQAHCFTLLLPVPSPLPTLTPTVITSNHSVFMTGCPGCAILAHWPQKAGQRKPPVLDPDPPLHCKETYNIVTHCRNIEANFRIKQGTFHKEKARGLGKSMTWKPLFTINVSHHGSAGAKAWEWLAVSYKQSPGWL